MPANIPKEIRAFLLENIDSIGQWEGLLLLRADPSKEWGVEEVARSLYIHEQETEYMLAQLVARGMVAFVTGKNAILYKYETKSPDIDSLIEQAAALYKQYLIPMTNLIHSKSKTRIQAFADAFKIRKD